MLYRLTLTFFLTLSVLVPKGALAEKQATIIYDAEMPRINAPLKGSYAQLASLIDQYRAQNPSTFFIFGGDSLGPSMISSMDRGAHIIDMLNSLAPNVMGVSKRELTYEEDELILRTYEAAFPIVSSNLFEPGSQQAPEGIKAYTILQQGQVKLGFMSILDPIILEKYPTKRLEVAEPESVIRETVKKIREQNVDLIVMHYSTYTPLIDQLLAEGVIDFALFKDQNLDLNVRERKPKHHNNIQITEETDAAVIQLTWQEDSPSDSLTVKSTIVNITNLPSKPQVLQQEVQYDSRLNSLLNEVVGTTNILIDLDRKTLRTSENNFANFVADTFKYFTEAQIVLINSGTFRGNKLIKEGEQITVKDIRLILPYRNKVKLIEANGQQINEALEHGLNGLEQHSGQFLQVAGIKVTYDSTLPVGQRLLSVTLNDKPLNPTQTYRVAILDYLLKGGDGFNMFKNNKILTYSQISNLTLSDIMTVEIQQQETIEPKVDGRLKDVSMDL
ncbi:bifunctional metallophosphatase/5'-nucleotidase [Marinomonas rhizomae]|uniref:bifunctional metallophosphatase/5'-nucleotidase n=1 Tax=Marinomonas rhizomae TaxID=491948 RepID=UPI0021069763|nr:5'-nucleotidase C-terminal domain-containing protein [Marinomonas rhizomae]UTV98989.1 bifunctional metallophosphatase/5'-nucleotidase [Marinomonas rhizomae]